MILKKLVKRLSALPGIIRDLIEFHYHSAKAKAAKTTTLIAGGTISSFRCHSRGICIRSEISQEEAADWLVFSRPE